MGSAVMMRNFPAWNHARVDVLTEEDETNALTVPGVDIDSLSEIVLFGSILFENYDTLGIYLGGRRVTSFLNCTVSATNKFVATHLTRVADTELWNGRHHESQWGEYAALVLSSYIEPYDMSAGGTGIAFGSNWNNQKILIGSYIDIYWR